MNVALTEEQKIKVLNSSDVYLVMQQILMRESKIERDFEHVWCVCLGADNKILNIELVSLGAINETILEPMQVFRIAILKGAVSLVIVHNHASEDDLEPSEADIDTTDRMIQVGNIVSIKVLDHLIINEKFYYSFKDDGLKKTWGQAGAGKFFFFFLKRTWSPMKSFLKKGIQTPALSGQLASFQGVPGGGGIYLTNL